MKVGYVAIDSLNSPGVAKKIVSKITAISELGIDIKCCLFSEEKIKETLIQNNQNFLSFQIPIINIPKFYNKRIVYRFQKFYYYKKLYEFIFQEIKKLNFDYIIFRYPGADISLLRLIRKIDAKVIFEYNSNALGELQESREFFLKKYFERSEKYILPFIVTCSSGIIGVTDELANYYLSKSFLKKKTITITNAIDISKNITLVKHVILNNVIKIAVVIGSGVTDWYGLDRLFYSIKNYSGKFKFHVYLVGKHYKKEEVQLAKDLNLNDIYFLGEKSQEELDLFYDTIHVGMAPLALHRIKLMEACTLKVREYGLKGIPTFCAYKEVGFEKHKNHDAFILQYSNDESRLDLNQLSDFVINFYSNNQNSVDLSEFIKKEFNYDKKALEIVNFLKTV